MCLGSIAQNFVNQNFYTILVSSDELYEDIHWLLLISCFILTIDNPSETTQLPDEIHDFTNQFLASNPAAIGDSVKYMMSLGQQTDCSAGNANLYLTSLNLNCLELKSRIFILQRDFVYRSI